ncbi:MAG: transmembrane anchor protein [Pseudomonadota bacterium]
MFNAEKPAPDELPTSAQLIRSTIISLVAAVAILFTIVLPAEYGIDPTRIGSVLGLTEMGQLKQDLADEAEQDHHSQVQRQRPSVLAVLTGALIGSAKAQEVWRDEISFTLTPGEGTEWKLVMAEGGTAHYAWEAEGGRVNYDLHGHAGGQRVDYEKGRGKAEGTGSFTAPFAGDHGWFWRNRDRQDITVHLKIRGDYDALKRTQ